MQKHDNDSAIVNENGAKVIQFNPVGVIAPSWLDQIPEPKSDIEKAEYETQYALVAAREFDAGYNRVKDVLEAAEESQDLLSTVPLGIARYCQGFFAKNEKGTLLRLKKFSAMVAVAGEELAKRHDIKRGSDSYSVMMSKFREGRLWVQFCSEARQALKYGIDLNKKVAGTNNLLYTNTRQVRTTAASMKQRDASEKAKKAQGAAEGTGTGEGQALGEGRADAQSLKLADELPQQVHTALSQFVGIVNGAKYEKNAQAAKRQDSNTQLFAKLCAFAARLAREIEASTLDAAGLGILSVAATDVLAGKIPQNVTAEQAAAVEEEIDAADHGDSVELPTPTVTDGDGEDATSATVSN